MSDQPDPLSVGCPTCGAQAGEPCRQDAAGDAVHLARRTLVEHTPPGI